jgi:hypothetical protein
MSNSLFACLSMNNYLMKHSKADGENSEITK